MTKCITVYNCKVVTFSEVFRCRVAQRLVTVQSISLVRALAEAKLRSNGSVHIQLFDKNLSKVGLLYSK